MEMRVCVRHGADFLVGSVTISCLLWQMHTCAWLWQNKGASLACVTPAFSVGTLCNITEVTPGEAARQSEMSAAGCQAALAKRKDA